MCTQISPPLAIHLPWCQWLHSYRAFKNLLKSTCYVAELPDLFWVISQQTEKADLTEQICCFTPWVSHLSIHKLLCISFYSAVLNFANCDQQFDYRDLRAETRTYPRLFPQSTYSPISVTGFTGKLIRQFQRRYIAFLALTFWVYTMQNFLRIKGLKIPS